MTTRELSVIISSMHSIATALESGVRETIELDGEDIAVLRKDAVAGVATSIRSWAGLLLEMHYLFARDYNNKSFGMEHINRQSSR